MNRLSVLEHPLYNEVNTDRNRQIPLYPFEPDHLFAVSGVIPGLCKTFLMRDHACPGI